MVVGADIIVRTLSIADVLAISEAQTTYYFKTGSGKVCTHQRWIGDDDIGIELGRGG